jgi:hypothetical protein
MHGLQSPRTDASSALQPPWVFPGRACAPAWIEPTTITPLGMAPPRQARTHRHRVRMTTTPEPGRLPSIRFRPRGRSRPDCARFYTRSLQPRTLSSAAIRSGPVTRRGGRFKLPLASKRPSRTAPALQGRCVSPMSAIDSRHEHPANRSIPGFASTSLATRFVRPPAAGATSFTWVEHRLTATLQLRLSTSIRVATRCPGFTPCMGANEIPLGPGGCRDRRPLRRYPPVTVFSTASRGDDVASDAPVAPGDLRHGSRHAGLHRTPSPLPQPPRQRRPPPRTRAPSIVECSLHPLAQTSRGARHRLTALPPRSGFRRPFAPPSRSDPRRD